MERTDIWDTWEWLVGQMDRMERKAGVPKIRFDDERLAADLEDRIDRARSEANWATAQR